MELEGRYVRGCYDAVAAEYAERFCGELAHKPLDRELLQRFGEETRGAGPVLDLGCGPGQTTALLHAAGAAVTGVDLSPELVRLAREHHPRVRFVVGDMLDLPFADNFAAGIVAFYAIVHFNRAQLDRALREARRVLRPGGRLLVAFHVGEEAIHVEDFLGKPVSLDFVFWPVDEVTNALESAAFGKIQPVVREPDPTVEYPSLRAYLSAQACHSYSA